MNSRLNQQVRGKITRETIIEVAERLWGDLGLNGVSLRQIAAAAGLLNHASVQYHFGNRDGLLMAVFENRLPVLDVRREELWVEATRSGKAPDLRTLLDILYRPLMEMVDADGVHRYAAFLLQAMQHDWATAVRIAAWHSAPVNARTTKAIHALLSKRLPEQVLAQRFWGSSLCMLGVIVRHERQDTGLPLEAAYTDALDMVAAGIAVPLSRSVGTAVTSSEAGPTSSKIARGPSLIEGLTDADRR